MGMRGTLEQVSEEQLKAFIKNPRLAYDHIFGQRGAGKRNATKLQIVKASNESRKQFSLEKGWHLLHYILNGTPEGGTGPLAQVVLGGTEIPNPDGQRDQRDYDALRYLTPAQVKEVAIALAQVDAKKLAEAFDAEDAAKKGIYGMLGVTRLPASSVSFILQQLPPEKRKLVEERLTTATKPKRPSPESVTELIDPVRTFYQEAARNNDAMLLYIS